MSNTTHRLAIKITHLLIVLILVIAVNLTAPLIARAQTGVRYAAPIAQGSGDCSSWTDACTLKNALDTAGSGDEIWVQEGVHLPGTIRTATFTLKSDVALYGGFDGTETSLDKRDWQTNLTILSGDIDGDDIDDDGNNIAETTDDIQGANAYHVVTGGGTDSTAVLDGFIVTAGQANGSWPQSNGGGMYNYNSSPTLRNITFSGNTAKYGGGMYNNSHSSPRLKNVTFSGNDAKFGGGMYNSSSPTLTNVTFSGNTATDGNGGGMYNSSSPTLTDVTFSGNAATNRGGGMFNNSSSPTLTNVTFSGNAADLYGGGMYNEESSSPTLTNVTFSDNTGMYGGGGMYNEESSSPTLTNVTFSDNTGMYGGGGMDNNSSSPTLTDVIFSSNTGDRGGGMYNKESSSLTLTNVTFSSNTGDRGGGMYNHNSSPTLTNLTFSGNTASEWGGGIYNNINSSPTLTDVTFSDNTATNHGGGMYNDDNSNPTLLDVTFSGNSADVGGGMYNRESSIPTLTDVTFSDNAADYGSGMYNYESSPTLTDITFSGNTATDFGGGMYNSNSSPTLTNVTFSGNIATDFGGGLYNLNNSSPTLTNVTLSGNSADVGGGMYNTDLSTPTLTNVTFSGNSADVGGGMYNTDSSTPTLTNVIMWDDIALAGSEIYNIDNSTPRIAYSDIQGCGGSGTGWDIDCGTDDGGNIDADPRFIDSTNGNLRLQPTSPAIDAGDNAAVPSGITTDLDGNPRFVDILTIPDTGSGTPPIVDMGAYEAQNTPPVSDAGPDQTVDTGDVVTLDGSGSSDPDGDLPLTYLWEQTGGTTVTLSDPTVVKPTFTAPDDPDVLTFSLTVTDSLGMSDPTPDEVVITVQNTPPVSDAGPDQTVDTGDVVTLDGSGSSDPDGDLPLTYQWTQTGGTTVTLSDPTAVKPTFTAPDDPDVLTFTLTVTDSLGMPDPTPDKVVITVQNTPPVSDAGPDQTVDTGDVVTLDGSGSSDPDGDFPLTYQWAQTGGTTVTLSGLTAVDPSFTAPDDPDVLTFTLTVTDSLGMSDPTPDEVVITVERLTYYFFFPLIFK